MKATVHYCICDGGDGSASVYFFAEEKMAQARNKYEAKQMGYEPFHGEAVSSQEFEFDEHGNMLKPIEAVALDEDTGDDIYWTEGLQTNLDNLEKDERMHSLYKQFRQYPREHIEEFLSTPYEQLKDSFDRVERQQTEST